MPSSPSRGSGPLRLGAIPFFLAILLLFSGPAAAQPTPIPPPLQAVIFKKVFQYDKQLRKRDWQSLRILFLYRKSSEKEAMGDIVEAFKAVGVGVLVAHVDSQEKVADSASAVYVMPGVDSKKLQKLCSKHRIISITGYPDLVQHGQAAVGVGLRNQRPQIIVHLKRLQSDGHILSVHLLNLVETIK